MGNHVASERPPGDSDENRRRCRDVTRHIGFITTLVGRWFRSGHFRGSPFDEIKHIALIEADRLLKHKYDPTKATVSSFLSSYLYSRVEYHVGTGQGRKKRREGWVAVRDLDPPARQREPPPNEATDFEDLIQSLHPDFRDICRRIGYGESLEDILAEIHATPLFNSLSDDHITMHQLVSMLRSTLRQQR